MIYPIACEGDTLAALKVWLHLNYAGILNQNMIFAFLKCNFPYQKSNFNVLKTD
jgi:hypothetical protein